SASGGLMATPARRSDGREDASPGVGPMGPCEALATGLAVLRGAGLADQRARTAEDVATAAWLMTYLADAGWVIEPGEASSPREGAAALAWAVARMRGRPEPTLQEKAGAERLVEELRVLGFRPERSEETR
ncbi:hypothetical protein, partial [Cronobacter sakazakii]|uniref:hypothetical protein n=1 Tax=Cronobacter sakazakii TaxID=28141 RepID=UPI001F1CB169